MRRCLSPLAVLLALVLYVALCDPAAAAPLAGPASAPGGPYTADDTLAALDGAPYMVNCIVRLETGGTYDPYALGASGEQGVIQLLPAARGGGQWSLFWYSYEWTSLPSVARSTWNPYEEVAFLEWYGARYGYGAWSTAPFC